MSRIFDERQVLSKERVTSIGRNSQLFSENMRFFESQKYRCANHD